MAGISRCHVLGLVLLASTSAVRAESPAPALPPESAAECSDNGKPSAERNDFDERCPAADIQADLTDLQQIVARDWILSGANGVDSVAEIAQLKARLAGDVKRGELIIELQRLLSRGIDGHATVGQFRSLLQKQDGYNAPFLINLSGSRYVAYRLEHLGEGDVNSKYKYRFEPLRDGFPYLIEMDGLAIERWIDVASQFVPKGAPSAVRWRAAEWLHCLPFFREQLGLSNATTVRVKLESEDRSRTVEVKLPTEQFALSHFYIPRPFWKFLPDNLGYLWVRNTNSGGAGTLIEGMRHVHETEGLVLDLRGNAGGVSPETLQIAAAFLIPDQEPTRIVGATLLPKGKLKNGDYTVDSPGLSETERLLISRFEKQFRPAWKPEGTMPRQLSYLLVTNPAASGAKYEPYSLPQFPRGEEFRYDKPVVVLMDHTCFSAAEILLSGLRELPNVTLIGAPSSGGACGPRIFPLKRTGISVVLGERVFFRADGRLIDGHGVEPDVTIHPDPDYYHGRRDRMLEKAVEVLSAKMREES